MQAFPFSRRPRRIVLFGDSITQYSIRSQGFGLLLQQAYERKCDVVIRGFSGYNSRWALKLLPCILDEWNDRSGVCAWTIFFGANDAADPQLNPKQHVPIAEYEQNIRSMIRLLKDRQQSKIIVIAPPAIEDSLYANGREVCWLQLLCSIPFSTMFTANR